MPHHLARQPSSSAPDAGLPAPAYASADLLIEIGGDGAIAFADGAFQFWFGRPASDFLGQPLTALVAAGDHAALAQSLRLARLSERPPSVTVRLANADASPMTLALLTLHGSGRLYATVNRQGAPGSTGSTFDTQALDAPDELGVSSAAPVAEPGAPTGCPVDVTKLASEINWALRRAKLSSPARAQVAALSLAGVPRCPARAARGLRVALGSLLDDRLAGAQTSDLGPDLTDCISVAARRTDSVRTALRERRFKLVFQPIVRLRDRKVQHFEALLRPDPIPAIAVNSVQDFILFAEAAGLSEELDWAVLNAAAEASIAAGGATVAVNVSGHSIQSPTFRDRALQRLVEVRRAGARLFVELTETAHITDLNTAVATMAGLRAAGIPVCLDDFGAGASAFRYLREFRVDYVKLDGSYVREAPTNAREHGFLLTMVELANFMGAKTVAETIETEVQARLMQEIGVDFGQGYLFGRPGPLLGEHALMATPQA